MESDNRPDDAGEPLQPVEWRDVPGHLTVEQLTARQISNGATAEDAAKYAAEIHRNNQRGRDFSTRMREQMAAMPDPPRDNGKDGGVVR